VRQLIARVVLTRHGAGEVIEVVVHWRGGAESRHEAYQGLRRYADLAGFKALKARVKELRGQGKTGDNLVEPPWYGPVRPVVWEGWSRKAPPYPDPLLLYTLNVLYILQFAPLETVIAA
jgi:hypothetical protein